MKLTIPSRVAVTRLLVGALGERAGWWTGNFTQPVAQRSLERLFPKTALRASLESVTEAARRHHDQRLSPGSVHLFRLPLHLEDRVADWLTEQSSQLRWPPASQEDVAALLHEHAVGAPVSAPGPYCLGAPGRLREHAPYREAVALYLAAWKSEQQVVPFFEENNP